MIELTKRLKCKLAERTITNTEEYQLEEKHDDLDLGSHIPTKRIHLDLNVPPDIRPPKQLHLKNFGTETHIEQPSFSKLTIDINDMNTIDLREDSISNMHKALPDASWDVLDSNKTEHIQNFAEKIHNDQAVFLDMVIKNVSNAFLGMESDLFEWNSESRQYEVPVQLKGTRLGSFMALHTANGSYLRRILQICKEIRSSGLASRSLLSLAIAIEREISFLRIRCLDLNLQKCTSPVEFTTVCLPLAKDTELLAMLVGCNDLNKSGKLKRQPNTIELINRAYMKAQNSNSSMLWRLIESCIRPWISQLSFAVGLETVQLKREFDGRMRDEYFPDLFIMFPSECGVNEEAELNLMVDSEKVPLFIPLNVAEAVTSCYYSLVYIGMKSERGIDELNLGGARAPSFKPLLHTTSTLQLNKFRAVESYDIPHSAIDEIANSHFEDDGSGGVETFALSKTLEQVLPLSHELDKYARKLFNNELHQFITVITDLLLLADGRIWSLMCDAIDRVRPEITPSLINELADITNSSCQNVSVCINRDNRLEVTYEYTDIISTIFGEELIQLYKGVSSHIIMLQMNKRYDELGLYCSDVGTISTHIWDVYNKAESLRELIKAVNQIRSLT